ncbi:hypothetical protein GBF38_000228, partial [Nibea albiflora]
MVTTATSHKSERSEASPPVHGDNDDTTHRYGQLMKVVLSGTAVFRRVAPARQFPLRSPVCVPCAATATAAATIALRSAQRSDCYPFSELKGGRQGFQKRDDVEAQGDDTPSLQTVVLAEACVIITTVAFMAEKIRSHSLAAYVRQHGYSTTACESSHEDEEAAKLI